MRRSNAAPKILSRSRTSRANDLLRGPLGRRVFGDVDVEQAAAFERKHEEHVQHTEGHGGHCEEVDGNRADGVGANECSPRWGRRLRRAHRQTRHVPRHRVLAHVVAELREFIGDPSTAPQWVLAGHSHDERHDLWRERRSSDAP
jgi:hypothetical protein